MPNRKTDTNNNGAFSTDNIGMNYDYPDGDYATREKIWQDHVTYQLGWLWFLANDPRVPEQQRKIARNGDWRRTNSRIPATGRTSCTSARPGG